MQKLTKTTVTISIHTLRVEGDEEITKKRYGEVISIHTLRVEGDVKSLLAQMCKSFISIHTLRVEGDQSVTTL